MRIAALILGIIGSLVAIPSTLAALGVGAVGVTTGQTDTELMATAAVVALVVCLLGFLAAGLAMGWPTLGGVLLLGCGVAFAVYLHLFGLLAAPLYVIAGVLALLGRGR